MKIQQRDPNKDESQRPPLPLPSIADLEDEYPEDETVNWHHTAHPPNSPIADLENEYPEDETVNWHHTPQPLSQSLQQFPEDDAIEDETVNWHHHPDPRQDVVNPKLDSPSATPTSTPTLQPTKKRSLTLYLVGAGVIVFVGVNLGAEALRYLGSIFSCGPSLVGNAEAKQAIYTMNRAQQAQLGETKQFSESLTGLNVGIQPQTRYFQYSTVATPQAAFNYAIPNPKATEPAHFGIFEWQKSALDRLNSQVGAVFIVPQANQKAASQQQPATVSIVCEAVKPGLKRLDQPRLEGTEPVCPAGTRRTS